MRGRPKLILRPLRASDELPLRQMQADLAAEGFDLLPEGDTWAEVMARAAREAAGVDLDPGRVRADFLVAEVAGDVVGRASVRYALTDWLYRFGGHTATPSHRRIGGAVMPARCCASRCNGCRQQASTARWSHATTTMSGRRA